MLPHTHYRLATCALKNSTKLYWAPLTKILDPPLCPSCLTIQPRQVSPAVLYPESPNLDEYLKDALMSLGNSLQQTLLQIHQTEELRYWYGVPVWIQKLKIVYFPLCPPRNIYRYWYGIPGVDPEIHFYR